MREGIVIGATYQHFKGPEKLYEIIALARNCEDPEEVDVIYKQLYNTPEFSSGTVWRRSFVDFCGEKVLERGKKVKRFTLVEVEQS